MGYARGTGLPFVFSTFFEWWYGSGTLEVRMRYAVKFADVHNFWIYLKNEVVYHGGVKPKSIQDIGSVDLV